MKVEKYLPHLVTVSLLAMAAIFKNPAYAFASVASILGILIHNVVVERLATMTPKSPSIDEATKRAIQDLNARVATLEYGVKTRGF